MDAAAVERTQQAEVGPGQADTLGGRDQQTPGHDVYFLAKANGRAAKGHVTSRHFFFVARAIAPTAGASVSQSPMVTTMDVR